MYVHAPFFVSGLLLLSLPSAWAGDLLDPTFELDPRIQGRIDVMNPVPDGSIYLGGLFTNVFGPTNVMLLRLKPDGRLDETFQPWTPVEFSAQGVASIESVPDQGLWVTTFRTEIPFGESLEMTSTSFGDLYVIASDTSITSRRRSFEAYAQVTIQPGVQAFLWGSHAWVFSAGGFDRPFFERISLGLSDAHPFMFPEPPVAGFWTTPGGPNHVRTVSTTPNGDLLIFGPLSIPEQSLHGPTDFGRFTSTGWLLWSFSWSEGPVQPTYHVPELVTAAEVSSGAVLLAATDRRSWRPGKLARLGTNGMEDFGYVGPRELVGVSRVLIEPDGRLLLTGPFTNFLGLPRPGLAALLPDGSLDLGFAPAEGLPGNPTVLSLKRQEDGRILVLGDLASNPQVPERRLFRLEPPGAGGSTTQSNLFYLVVQHPPHECSGPGRVAVVRMGNLDKPARVRLRTVSQSAILGLDFVPLDLAIELAAQERFRAVALEALSDAESEYYETVGIELLVEPEEGFVLEPRVWSVPIVDQPCEVTLATNAVITSEANLGVQIRGQYPVHGDLSAYRFRLRTYDGSAVAGRDYSAVDWTGRWQEWPEIPIHDNSTYQGQRHFLVELSAVGGGFSVSEPSVTKVTITDNDSLAGPSRGIRGGVNELLGAPNGRWVVVGNFDSIDGTPRSGFAQILDDGRLDESFTMPPDLDGPIRTALVQSDGKIIVGGRFTRCWGMPAPGIARLLPNGALDPTPPIYPPPEAAKCSEFSINEIRLLSRQSDGSLWVSGSLPRFFNCTSGSQIAVFDADGTWSRGWNMVNDQEPATITATPMSSFIEPIIVTTGGFLRQIDGSRLRWPGSDHLGRFLPVAPLNYSSGGFIMPRYREISQIVRGNSTFEAWRTNQIDTPEGRWEIFQISAWHPLPNRGEVLMCVSGSSLDLPSRGGPMTGRFHSGRWSSLPTLPLSFGVLGAASDGRTAGVVYHDGADSSAIGHFVRFTPEMQVVSKLRLSPAVVDPDGATHLAWSGNLPLLSTLEVSSDLNGWNVLKTNTLPNSSDIYIDQPDATSASARYYRLRY
ncbi:MAG TPA: Calx-beta domain-containing protein [Verrucomicrobiota bacterium]|nr:hypothetical protein [Verrucomicrobiales bacterium]HRI11736.1 Calx-beta domain-containing protein [Verrucomicrobiota bacterium]